MKTMVCLDHLGYSGFNHEALLEINRIAATLNEISIATVDITNKFLPINTAIYNLTEMHSFLDGVMVAGSLENAKRVLACSNNSKKVLYLYDLEWLYDIMMWSDIYDILSDPDLTVICRSESHRKTIKRSFNIECNLLDKFDLEKIWNLLKETKTR